MDDEPLTRQYMRTNLTLLHDQWECAGEAADGQEALDLLDRGQSFDLIMTDIKMPVMSGLELACEVAKRKLNMRMVIISGYDEFSLAKEAMKYGVHDYLLKPLVKEELIAMLDNMCKHVEADRAAQLAYKAMVSLSVETKEQVAKNFLRALVSENNIEIKELYPILFRLKISLIEGEGVIMLVDLDDAQLLQRNISPSDITLFRYIVHQTAIELVIPILGAIVFFDSEQQTTILVTGDDAADVLSRCQHLFAQLSKIILNMTGIAIWGAVGSYEIDVLQLNSSYQRASRIIKDRLFVCEPTLFFDHSYDSSFTSLICKLDHTIATLPATFADSHHLNLTAVLKAIVELMYTETPDQRKVIQLGTYILKRLLALMEAFGQQTLHQALEILRQNTDSATFTSEEVVRLYLLMLQPFLLSINPPSAANSEHEIVTKAKNYIYAHFAEPLSLALIADQSGVTPGYLSSLFHQNVNESYIKFLTRVRMEHAAKLLQAKPPEKVYDVSEKVGYVSVKHFSYVFKQHYGIPPGEYQERALN
ncbi:response regulator [Cohnella sp. WQ 127256]|uniref:response regulator n=1 Tax=Cohnella sp. WQ 127256 TaxID=2938790 RepID=UPI0021196358